MQKEKHNYPKRTENHVPFLLIHVAASILHHSKQIDMRTLSSSFGNYFIIILLFIFYQPAFTQSVGINNGGFNGEE